MQFKKNDNNISKFPVKPIKRIIKKYYHGEVTKDSCIYVRNLILDIVEYYVEECVEEFNSYNRRRQEQNLPVLKRLDKFVFVNISDKVFKPVMYKNIGKVGRSTNLLLCQDSDIINKKGNDIIVKDADGEVIF
jgi:hypothetical protein